VVVLQTLRTSLQIIISPFTTLTIFLGYLLPTDWQTASARNDRERINRTRQNAEDLFKPK